MKLVGIVEAKKAAIDIPSVIDHQCKEYAKGIKAEHKEYIINQWGAYKVPFVFATNGVAGHAKRHFSLSRKNGIKPL